MPKSAQRDALRKVHLIVSNLAHCRTLAAEAAQLLYGARVARAYELLNDLEAAQQFAERLSFVILGDVRADEWRGGE